MYDCISLSVDKEDDALSARAGFSTKHTVCRFVDRLVERATAVMMLHMRSIP